MGKDVHYTYKRGTPLTPEQIAMIEAATPERYAALMRAVAERNRRVIEKLRSLG